MHPVKPKRVYEDVSDQIQALLRRQQLRAGDRLPPERQLAELFRVSRNSVREAIKILEQQGVLASRPGAGTFIVDSTALPRELHKAMLHERHRLADIFELRLLLEPQIAQLAAERIAEADLRRLTELVLRQEDARAPDDAREFDLAFHQCIAASTGNQAIVQLMEHVHGLLAESRDEALQSVSRVEWSVSGHRAILAALARHESHEAGQAMATHLRDMRGFLFEPTAMED